MLVVSKPADLLSHINYDLGHGDWILVDQRKIDEFASISGDHQWIHVDTKRAVNEMPDGKTIAHGLLTLCMSAALAGNVLKIEQLRQSINYGIDKVRFTSSCHWSGLGNGSLLDDGVDPFPLRLRFTYIYAAVERETRASTCERAPIEVADGDQVEGVAEHIYAAHRLIRAAEQGSEPHQ